MSSRHTFLQSALFLPSLLAAHAFAQDTNTAPSAPFADFENGWGDWTLEGDAFGSAPATDALFPGKIRGFGGRGFLCTLHPRKGNAATGKAISREFTIEKPFITFIAFPFNSVEAVYLGACPGSCFQCLAFRPGSIRLRY